MKVATSLTLEFAMAIVHSTAALIQHQWLMSLGEETRRRSEGTGAMRDSKRNLHTLMSL